MMLQRLAHLAFAILMAVAAMIGSSGIAHADPEDEPPIIIDDLLFTPIFTQDQRMQGPADIGPKEDWGHIGMVCQNRTVKCQKNGF